HHAADGLPNGVETDAVTVGAVLPIRRDVDHDNAGVQGFELVVPKPHSRNGARTKVLDQNIRDLDQLTHDLLALLVAHVEAQALLAAVVLHPIGALAAHKWPPTTTLIATGRLDLNDLSPQTRQHKTNARPGLVAPQIQNSDAFQRCLRHGHCCLLSVWNSRDKRRP